MDSKILKALGIDPALIFIFLLILIVILFVLYVNVTMKYNRLKSSYTTFMRGKDGKTLEESMMSGFSDVEAILKYTKQNRTDIQKLNKKMEKSYQKLGIVKYDAFNEMGGKLSFALAMLDNNNTGWIINAMHSREGCYTYIKEIVKGESYILLGEEERQALEKAIDEEDDGHHHERKAEQQAAYRFDALFKAVLGALVGKRLGHGAEVGLVARCDDEANGAAAHHVRPHKAEIGKVGERELACTLGCGGELFHRGGFTGQRGLRDKGVLGREEQDVARQHVAGREAHDVAPHDLAHIDLAKRPVP